MKNTQKGRSMVEMLGVLAIIGVLSVGGIAGYTVAMNRYRANQILDMASKVAIVAQTMNRGQGGCVVVGAKPSGAGSCAGSTEQAEVAASTKSGLTWTTTVGGVSGFWADATSTGGTSDSVTVYIDDISESAEGVAKAIKSIAGTQYNGSDQITIKTN